MEGFLCNELTLAMIQTMEQVYNLLITTGDNSTLKLSLIKEGHSVKIQTFTQSLRKTQTGSDSNQHTLIYNTSNRQAK